MAAIPVDSQQNTKRIRERLFAPHPRASCRLTGQLKKHEKIWGQLTETFSVDTKKDLGFTIFVFLWEQVVVLFD